MDAIMDVYAAAKEFMKATGNANQWSGTYPEKELIESNMADGSFYVCETDGGRIAGTFYFKVERDPTYTVIEGGEWLNDEPYGVVHRIASNGIRKGVADLCLQWCFDHHGNIRIDTHRENRVMQNILKKNGYTRCGIIYLGNGDERIAFHKC